MIFAFHLTCLLTCKGGNPGRSKALPRSIFSTASLEFRKLKTQLQRSEWFAKERRVAIDAVTVITHVWCVVHVSKEHWHHRRCRCPSRCTIALQGSGSSVDGEATLFRRASYVRPEEHPGNASVEDRLCAATPSCENDGLYQLLRLQLL